MNAKRDELLGLPVGAMIQRGQMERLMGDIPIQTEFTICIGRGRHYSVFRSFKKYSAEGIDGWEVTK